MVDWKKKRKLCVVATFRSATTYMTLFLRKLGLDTGHMRLGDDAFVGTSMAVGEIWTTRLKVEAPPFEQTWHQVRGPLDVIASLQSGIVPPRFWRLIGYQVPNLPEDLVLRAMVYWLSWNNLCEQCAEWRFRIEDLKPDSELFAEMCRRLELKDAKFPVLPMGINHREYLTLTWPDLERADGKLAAEIKMMAQRYGYDT